MRLAVLLVAGLLPGLAQAQSSCAYGARECHDGRDNTNRVNHDDLANRTKVLAVTTLDITDRANHDDLANRTKVLAVTTADIADRANHDVLANRTRILAVPTGDITERTNHDDLTEILGGVNAEGVEIGDTQGTRAESFRRPLIDSARQSV